MKKIKTYFILTIGIVFFAVNCSSGSGTENVVDTTQGVTTTEASVDAVATTTNENTTTTQAAVITERSIITTTTEQITTTTQLVPPVTTPDEIVYVKIKIDPLTEKWAPCIEGIRGGIWDDGKPITVYVDENGVCRSTRTEPDYAFWINEDGEGTSVHDDGFEYYSYIHPDPSIPLFDSNPAEREDAS